jgi:hypothetical protein
MLRCRAMLQDLGEVVARLSRGGLRDDPDHEQ